MAPPPGRVGGTVKLPVQVRMFPAEIAAVDAFAAELSQQSYGAAFSRAEALRIAALEWLKDRQARQTHETPAQPRVRRPPRQRSRPRPRLLLQSLGPWSPPPCLPRGRPGVRGRSWRPSRPRGRRGSGRPRCARPPASPRGRSPVRCMAWCSGGRSAQCTTSLWQRGRSVRRGPEAPRRAAAGARPPRASLPARALGGCAPPYLFPHRSGRSPSQQGA